MPCNQILVNTISFEHATGHLDLLVEALKAEGYSVQRSGDLITFQNGRGLAGNYQKGKFETRTSYGETFDVDAVKRSFAKQVVKKASKQYGWTVVDKGNNNYQLRKRV